MRAGVFAALDINFAEGVRLFVKIIAIEKFDDATYTYRWIDARSCIRGVNILIGLVVE